MYETTRLSYKILIADIRIYIDNIDRNSNQLEHRLKRIAIADSNRHLHHTLKMFRNHLERDDYNTALIMLAICRNKLYKYIAEAMLADVDFDISGAAGILNDIEQYAKSLQIKEAIQNPC